MALSQTVACVCELYPLTTIAPRHIHTHIAPPPYVVTERFKLCLRPKVIIYHHKEDKSSLIQKTNKEGVIKQKVITLYNSGPQMVDH